MDDKDLDLMAEDLLEKALSRYGNQHEVPGLEGRIMKRLRSDRGKGRWAWPAAAGLAAAAAVAAVILIPSAGPLPGYPLGGRGSDGIAVAHATHPSRDRKRAVPDLPLMETDTQVAPTQVASPEPPILLPAAKAAAPRLPRPEPATAPEQSQQEEQDTSEEETADEGPSLLADDQVVMSELSVSPLSQGFEEAAENAPEEERR